MLRSQSGCTQNVIGGYIGRKMIRSPQFTQNVPTGFQVTSPPVPCACTNHLVDVVVAPRTPPDSPPSYAVSKQLCIRSAGHPRSSFHPYRSPSPLSGLDMRLESNRKLRHRYLKQRGEFDRRGVGFVGSSSGDETDSWITD